MPFENPTFLSDEFPYDLDTTKVYNNQDQPIDAKKWQMLYECENERLVYKSCLRSVIELKRSIKHTSWDTADVSALLLN